MKWCRVLRLCTALLCFFLVFTIISPQAQASHQRRQELIAAAERAAPLVGRYACVAGIKNDLRKKLWYRPLLLRKKLRRIDELRESFAPKREALTLQENYDLGPLGRSIVLGKSLHYHALGHSLREGVASLIFFDAEEAISFKSFYVEYIFESDEFTNALDLCGEHFSHDTKSLHNRWLKEVQALNHLGYTTGVAVTFALLGGGTLKLFQWVPKGIRTIGAGVALGAGGYFVYEGPRGYIDSDAVLKKTEVDFEDPLDWSYIYNLSLEFYQLSHQELNREQSKKRDEVALALFEHKAFLEKAQDHFHAAIETGTLGSRGEALSQLVDFVLGHI